MVKLWTRNCFMLLLGALLWSICSVLPAADSAAKISKIVFDQQGGDPLSEELLKFNIRQQPGLEFSQTKLDEDVKRLYALGYFSDIVASTSPNSDGTLNVVIRLKLRPRVTEVIFDGNAKFKSDELRKCVNIPLNAPLNEKALRDSANELRAFYRDKGYLETEIAPVPELAPDNTVRVIFRIRENLKLKVNDVTFENNTVYSGWTLRHELVNRYSYIHWISFLNRGLLDRDALEVDKVRLRDLYLDKGYLDFKIEKTTITPCEDDPEFVDIHFVLHEGEPYTVKSVSVKGAKSFSDEELMGVVALAPGQVFDLQTENGDRERILTILHSEGYADATVIAKRDADFATHEATIVLEVNEGRQYHIDQVTIVGNHFTKDKVIRRELVVYPGDPADAALLDVSKSRLMGTDMFESVDATLVNSERFNEKDAVFKVKEKDAYTVRVGGGFSDVDNLFGMIEASCRNFDIANPGNYFRGGGQRLRFQAAIGIERGLLSLDFSEPWLFDIPLRLDMSAYLRETSYEYWDEQRWGAKIGLSHKVFDDFTTASLTYKFEQVAVCNMSRRMGVETRQKEEGREWVSQFTLMLDRNTMDSLLDPKNGYQVNLLAALAPRALGTSSEFYRLEAKGAFAKSFWDGAIVWTAGARVGVVNNFSNDGAPMYERYFLGGGDTLRGFPYRDVSPLDSSGKPVGGNGMTLITTEVSHPIWSFIRGAAFADAGGNSEEGWDMGFRKINIGLGYGLRIKVPQVPAPIKLDLAFPVLNHQDNINNTVRFHFNMGFSF